jgi:outer membrane immunogenic protein
MRSQGGDLTLISRAYQVDQTAKPFARRSAGNCVPMVMHALIVGLTTLLSTAMGASAADLPLPALPATNYMPTYLSSENWGGLYVGLNGGYGFGVSNWSDPNNPGNSPTPSTSSGDFNISGGLLGATFGANFQASSLVLGVEADLDWSSIKGSTTPANGFCTLTTGASLAAGTTSAGSTCNTNNNWLGTARLRVGYVTHSILWFVTGGAAFGNVQTGLSGAGGPALGSPGLAPATGALQSTVSAGWSAGGGAEFAIANNWTAKVEYLFVGLNANCNVAVSCGIDSINFTSGTAAAANNSVKFATNIVRFGINYKFGSW